MCWICTSGGANLLAVCLKGSPATMAPDIVESEDQGQVHHGGGRLEMVFVGSQLRDMGALTHFSFGFAFENAVFADRTLRLVIEATESEGLEGGDADGDGAAVDQNAYVSDGDDSAAEKSSASIAIASTKVRQLPVNSLLLAAKSEYFLKLFTNGMQESNLKSRPVSIHIAAHEEVAMMELLSVVYRGKISENFTKSFEALVELLIIADRFLVIDCIGVCGTLLKNYLPDLLPTQARLILDLAPALLSNPAIQPLQEPSRSCLVEHFGPFIEKDPNSFTFLELSPFVLEQILESDDLQVSSEELVFEAVLLWVRYNFPWSMDERKKVLNELSKHIRFQWMRPSFLRDTVLQVPELDTKDGQALVIQALASVAERSSPRLCRKLRGDLGLKFQPRSSYKPPDVSFLLELPLTACRTWADPAPRAEMQPQLTRDGTWLTVDSYIRRRTPEAEPHFCIYLRVHGFSQVKEVQCRARFMVLSGEPSSPEEMKENPIVQKEFVGKVCRDGWGFPDFFSRPWSQVLADSSLYFPGGIMRHYIEVWLK